MQKIIGFNIKRNKKLLVSDIIKFFEVRGYELTTTNTQSMIFERGSFWQNFSSMNPSKWQTKVNIDIIQKERMNYDIYANYEFNTTGLILSKQEKKYFLLESEALANALEKFEVNIDEVEKLAQENNRNNWQQSVISVITGSIISIICMYGMQALFQIKLHPLINSGITILLILSIYFILIALRNQKE